jgi:hypothetical protein
MVGVEVGSSTGAGLEMTSTAEVGVATGVCSTGVVAVELFPLPLALYSGIYRAQEKWIMTHI